MLTGQAKADDLSLGSPAPKLEIRKWYKGTPVTALEKGKLYVVEFWATWCGPCIEAIPHVTELAKKNTDVTFIGVSVFEEFKDDVLQKFIDKMGSKMDYNVGYSGYQDGMAKTWMIDANQNGIPTSFIVKDGVIQWVGHPMSLEEPLNAIKAGTYDLALHKKAFDESSARTKKEKVKAKAFSDCTTMFNDGKRAEAKAKLAELEKEYPEKAGDVKFIRFQWLAVEDPKKWEAEATRMSTSTTKSEFRTLLSFALRQAKSTPAAYKQGVKALELAEKATSGKDYSTLLYAVQFYKNSKNFKKELSYVEKILAILPMSEYKDMPEVKADWLARQKELKELIKA
jgi:thiol-disulfide isomerase/thioredoxin